LPSSLTKLGCHACSSCHRLTLRGDPYADGKRGGRGIIALIAARVRAAGRADVMVIARPDGREERRTPWR